MSSARNLPPEDAMPEADHTKAAPRVKGMSGRKRIRTGHLPGKWFAFGEHLVSVEGLAGITLPKKEDKDQSVSLLFSDGKTIELEGEDAANFMEEFGLSAYSEETEETEMVSVKGGIVTALGSDEKTISDDGRLLSAADREAQKDGRASGSAVDHPHRANARLTDAETDFDVQRRAGNAAIPPLRPDKSAETAPAPVETAVETESEEETDSDTAPESSKTAAPSPEPLPFDEIPEHQRTGPQKAARTREIHAREEAEKAKAKGKKKK